LELIAATREKTKSKLSPFDHLLVRISEEIGWENLFHQVVQIYIAGFNNASIP